MIIAIVLVVGAVGALIAFSGGKKDKPKPTTPSSSGPENPAAHQPVQPVRKVPPAVSADLKAKGMALCAEMVPFYEEAAELYNEANTLQSEGLDAESRKEMQRLLHAARDQLTECVDRWSQIEDMVDQEIGHNDDFGPDEIADHHFGRASNGIIGKVDKLNANVRKMVK